MYGPAHCAAGIRLRVVAYEVAVHGVYGRNVRGCVVAVVFVYVADCAACGISCCALCIVVHKVAVDCAYGCVRGVYHSPAQGFNAGRVVADEVARDGV